MSMQEISAKVVMELRGRTGAGMMDCKKALTAVEGDIEKAIDYLREKGLAAAAKKQSRIAAEGVVASFVDEGAKVGALLEVNCETDFVAKTPEYVELVNGIAQVIAATDPKDIEDLLQKPSAQAGQTVDQLITEKVAKIGEKITARRFERYALAGNGIVESYVHMGGTVGVLVEVHAETENGAKSEAFREFAHDVALQIAASAPEYVTRDQVKADHLEHEKEIFAGKARNDGKPENIIVRMVEGMVGKFYKEVCLLEQPFVKNPDQNIEQLAAEKGKQIGEKITVVRFARYKMGDGLEKKTSDLAAEVAEQTGMRS